MIKEFITLAREIYGCDFIPLHRPVFDGNEKAYLAECIDSNFVSSVGQRVIDFENMIANFSGAEYAVAVVNGTAALEVALRCAGVGPGDEVVTQDLTFVATANAVCHLGANPVFLDVDSDSMSLSPSALDSFLSRNARRSGNETINKCSGARLAACVPMHTFGNPGRVNELAEICRHWGVPLVEDAAESLGSYINGTHTGRYGESGVFSFNGNKIITTGGGGMIITDDREIAKLAKHLTTTAKQPHPFEFYHDEIAYNYRMPNLNAALGCAQMERLLDHLAAKSVVADIWEQFFESYSVAFIRPLPGSQSNNWLNAIKLKNRDARDQFLRETNDAGVMTRPVWELMSRLPMFKGCYRGDNVNARHLSDTIVNISSSVPDGFFSGVEGGHK